jgi:hypothetical protein
MARRLGLRHLALAGALGAAGAGACSSNHDVLKQKPPATGGTGTGGAPDASPDVALDAPADGFVEPKGADAVTLVHGVVDADHIAFCFAKVDAGVPGEPTGIPLPSGGLLFGGALGVKSLSGFDFAKDDIEPIVIAGDFSLLAGKTCADAIALAKSFEPEPPEAGDDADADAGDLDASLDASPDADASAESDANDDVADAEVELPPPPPLRALALPVLPAGTLGAGYSTLLVAAGCIGGPAFVHDLGDQLCGAGYSSKNSTLTPLLVRMSRVSDPNHVGLQAVNASLASDPLSFQSQPSQGSSLPAFAFAYGVGFGEVSPKPPELAYAKAVIGPVDSSELVIVASGSSVPAYSNSWKSGLSASGLDDLSDGKSYAVVYLGPLAGVTGKDKWWNAPRLIAVPTDP